MDYFKIIEQGVGEYAQMNTNICNTNYGNAWWQQDHLTKAQRTFVERGLFRNLLSKITTKRYPSFSEGAQTMARACRCKGIDSYWWNWKVS